VGISISHYLIEDNFTSTTQAGHVLTPRGKILILMMLVDCGNFKMASSLFKTVDNFMSIRMGGHALTTQGKILILMIAVDYGNTKKASSHFGGAKDNFTLTILVGHAVVPQEMTPITQTLVVDGLLS
jgi:hypothetical protein